MAEGQVELTKPTRHAKQVVSYVEKGAPEQLARDIVAKDILMGRGAKTKAEYKKTAETAMIDPLTGAFNRQYFNQRLSNAFQRTERQHDGGFPTEIGLLLFDLDHFKNVNDTFGHNEGDEVLKRFVATISSEIRDEDVLARWGGEEFVLLIRESHKLKEEEIKGMVERFSRAIQETVVVVGPDRSRQQITASMGLAFFNGKDEDRAILKPEDLISFADQAMYMAKAGGRNQAWEFDGFSGMIAGKPRFHRISVGQRPMALSSPM